MILLCQQGVSLAPDFSAELQTKAAIHISRIGFLVRGRADVWQIIINIFAVGNEPTGDNLIRRIPATRELHFEIQSAALRAALVYIRKIRVVDRDIVPPLPNSYLN